MLFLTSQAYNVLHKLPPLLNDKPENLTVAFIPTAANPYKTKPWMIDDRNKLIELGFNVFDLDLNNRTEYELRNFLKKVNVIFVAGGNTFYLLEKVIKSGFDKIVKGLIEKDVIYIGSSAGSVIAGPDIEAIEEFDDRSVSDLNTTKSLGLVDFVVMPHYESKKYHDLCENAIKKYEKKYKIIPITDQQVILVRNSKPEIIEE